MSSFKPKGTSKVTLLIQQIKLVDSQKSNEIELGVSKNRATPKWMVKVMENPIKKWMIWGYIALFLETPNWYPNLLGL